MKNLEVWPGDKTQKVVGVNWNRIKEFSELKPLIEEYKKDVYIFGDAMYPPIISDKVGGYFLWHNKKNFIGREYMCLFNSYYCELIFEIVHQDQIVPTYQLANQTVVDGYSGIITLVFENAYAFNKRIINQLIIDDFRMVLKSPVKRKYQSYPDKLVDYCDILKLKSQ
jgi:hypothetical protein